MKKSLGKFPERKRYELIKAVDIIRSNDDVEMVVLFGSYARGDFVEEHIYTEGRITYRYASDFDLLVIVPDNRAKKGTILEESLSRKILREKTITTSTSIIVHTSGYVKEMLAQGQYFFCDIIKEGIILYENGDIRLKPSRKITSEEVVKLVISDFRQWDESANQFYHTSVAEIEKHWNNKAAFELHQAAERWYHMVCLVFTGYKEKTHDIKTLGSLAAAFDLEFKRVFPQKTPEEKECFKLLRRAYIDARYKKDYKITLEQLEYLAKRVRKLRAMARRICRRKIDELKENT